VDLLVEQIECADFVILNKIDQLDAGQLESLKGIASSLNPLSKVSNQSGTVNKQIHFACWCHMQAASSCDNGTTAKSSQCNRSQPKQFNMHVDNMHAWVVGSYRQQDW